jgi:hypothetical protein
MHIEEITYRDSRNRTEPLYEITIDRNDNTYTASGYFNNRGGEFEILSLLEYTLMRKKQLYSLYPDRRRECLMVLTHKRREQLRSNVEGEWPEVLTVYDSDQILLYR